MEILKMPGLAEIPAATDKIHAMHREMGLQPSMIQPEKASLFFFLEKALNYFRIDMENLVNALAQKKMACGAFDLLFFWL